MKGLGAETANVFFAEAPEPTRAGERNLQDPAVRDSLEELGRVTSTNLLYWLAAADAKEGKKREAGPPGLASATPALSGAGPGQYWGGGPPGKPFGCC